MNYSQILKAGKEMSKTQFRVWLELGNGGNPSSMIPAGEETNHSILTF